MIVSPGPVDPSGRVAAFYTNLAPTYDEAYSGPAERAEDWALGWMLRRAGFNRPFSDRGAVLDLGCGTGLFLRLCPAHTAHSWAYLGFDLAEGMIAQARAAFPRNDLRVGDMTALPPEVPVGAYAGVVSLWGSVNYVEPRALRHTLDWTLKRGGRFFIMTLCPGALPAVHDPDMADTLHDYSDFGGLMRDHGFAVRARPFAREWRVPFPVGVAVELLGSRLPVGCGRHRYIIWEGVRL